MMEELFVKIFTMIVGVFTIIGGFMLFAAGLK